MIMAKANWDNVYRRDKKDVAWFSEQPCKIVMRCASEFDPCAVLEVGSGFGTNAVGMAKLGHRVTAVDISDLAIAKTAELAAHNSVDIRLVAGDFVADNLGLFDFDLLVDRCVFHGDPPHFIHAAKRALKPNGRWISIIHSGPSSETSPWGFIPSLTIEQVAQRIEPTFTIESINRDTLELNNATIPVLIVTSRPNQS